MKSRVTIFAVVLIFGIYFELIIDGQGTTGNLLQSNRKIPVYPTAKLIADSNSEETSYCCDFSTQDPLDKVVAFYENALNLKAMDVISLSEKYPDMRPQIDLMIRQMPTKIKIKFFPIQEYSMQGKKGAELFEVVSDQSGVNFNITESQLLPDDTHFAEEFNNKKTAVNQPESMDPARLEQVLPTVAPDGFQKGEVTLDNSTQSTMSITYSKLISKASGGEDGALAKYANITVTITDGSTSQEYINEMVKPEAKGEKAVMVKDKYEGKENIEKNDFGCVGSDKIFIVNKRFLVEIRAEAICDIAVINKFIENMNFGNLPR